MITSIVLLWIPVILLIVSFTEWYVHKYNMHKKGILRYLDKSLYEGHAKKHHVIFSYKYGNPTQEELDDIPHSVSDLMKVATIFAIMVLVIAYFWSWSINLLIGIPLIYLTAYIWAKAWSKLHVLIHTPSWEPKNAITRYYRDYHTVHHYYSNTNFNALILGFDWLMGTYKSPKDIVGY